MAPAVPGGDDMSSATKASGSRLTGRSGGGRRT